ncbi:hypothetical protein GCK72_011807 [Caenorhabditis remanei]|uniref:Domain of unknown function WSN domain-containing protein n=1 Tax=Caenorhabditis remanei TaxID=31234 RepID=A0A6A5H9N8_CAERE|nr:hypothetical protein GCK72_011807 [Caenorhabditis remanei]KAF1763541.1 hypothetical protein GCK72_011807 [Caenorhabditis remanei]
MREKLMMIAAVLLISILTANLNTASAKNVPENVDKLVSYFNNLAFSSDVQFVRADRPIYEDPMTVIENLRGVARIVAAITLQNGLSDGSISIENATVELMNFDIPLSDLKKFDKKKMDDFVDKLVEMKNKMSNGSEKAEDAFIKLHEIREQWREHSVKMKDFPKNLSALEGLKKWNTDVFKKVDIDKVSNMKKESEKDYKALETALTALMSEISSLTKPFDTVPAEALLRNLSHLEEFVDIMGQLNTDPFIALNGFTRLKKYFGDNSKVVGEIPIGGGDRQDSKMLDAISKSLLAIHKKDARLVTTGFINGFNDLGQLEKDLENPWILTVLDPLYNLNGTKSVTRFKSPIEKFHESWNSLTVNDHYRAVKKILKIQFMFEEVSIQNALDFGATVASKLDSCQTLRKQDTTFLKTAASNIQNIYSKVMALHNLQKISGNYSIFLKQNMIAETINYLKENLDNLKKDINWKTTVEEITNEISTESAQAIIDYTTHLNCLIKLEGPFKEVATASRVFKTMRSLNISAELAANFKKVSSAMAVSIEKVPEILAAGKMIKEDQSSEVRELKKMLLLRNHSRTFGHVSMLLQTVKLAISKDTSIFNTFVNDGEQIAEVSKLKEFQSTRQEILEFIKNAIAWKNGMKVNQSSRLYAYGHHLAALSNLNDVDLHTEMLLEIVEKLEDSGDATIKKKCENLMMSLRKMSGMELKFSKYSSELKEMPRDMMDMLRIFSTPTNEPPEKVDHVGISIFWITLICVGALVFVAAIYFCFFDWRFPIYKLRQMFKKPVMKTAREGKPPPGGFPNQQKSVGPDGREIREKRKKKDDSDYEMPPPPPPPPTAKDDKAPPTKDNAVPEKKNVSDGKKKPSVTDKKEDTKMVVEKVDETKTPPNASAPGSSTLPSTSKADTPSSPPPPSKPIPKPPAAPSKVNLPPLATKKATGERTRDSGDVKTRTTQEKTRPTSTKDEESTNEEKNKKNKKKVDTLAADTTSSTNLVKTRSADTQKFTVDNRKTLDEVPNPEWDKKFEPPNTSEPPPPLPHKKEKAKKAEK